MAFTTIPAAWIVSGQPTKKELFEYIKDNEDDLDSRTSALESALTSETPIYFQVTGPYYKESTPILGLTNYIRIPFNIRLTSGIVYNGGTVGSGGTLEVDVKYKRGAAAFTTVFSSNPTVTAAAGAFAYDAGVLSVTDLDAGDYLRLDAIQVQNLQNNFSVYLTWEVR